MPRQPKPRKAGRPPLPKGNAKAGFLRVRMTQDELQTIEKEAKTSGKTISEFVRSKLIATAEA
jgi:uncharacterized protein (DUF1778 family)